MAQGKAAGDSGTGRHGENERMGFFQGAIGYSGTPAAI